MEHEFPSSFMDPPNVSGTEADQGYGMTRHLPLVQFMGVLGMDLPDGELLWGFGWFLISLGKEATQPPEDPFGSKMELFQGGWHRPSTPYLLGAINVLYGMLTAPSTTVQLAELKIGL